MQDPAPEPKSSATDGEDKPARNRPRGNHSRPLDEGAASKRRPSAGSHGRKPSSGSHASPADEGKAAHEDASKSDAVTTDAAKAADTASEGKDAAKPRPSEGEKKAAHDEEPSKDRKREVIVPEDAFEPESMVDTSANKMQVKQRQVFRENPNIYYMNGESLSRPMTLPPSAKVGIIVIIVIAAVLASVAFYMYFDATTNEPAREQARMQEQLDREVTLDLPDMLSMLELDDATIDAQLKGTGATFFERSAVGTGEDYEMVKLPADVTLVDAAAMYASGVSKLTPSQAATLLNGSWDLMIERSNGLDMSLHYADFKSGNESNAITNAIAAEGLERGTVTDSGDNDGYGNHFTQGTIMINGVVYDWTVSSVALKDVYSINGLPDDAVYVGIRIKKGAE